MERAGKFTNPFEKLKVASFLGFTLMVATLTIAVPEPSWPVVSARRGAPGAAACGATVLSLHAAVVPIRNSSAGRTTRRVDVCIYILLVDATWNWRTGAPDGGIRQQGEA